MKDNQVWVLVELPPNGQTVRSKWLFKKKTDMDGYVHTLKACLVAKGYTQTYDVDYEETFFPIADIRALRILLAITAFYDYEIWQMDVKNAFLNGHLSEDSGEIIVEGKVKDGVSHLKKVGAFEVDVRLEGNVLLCRQFDQPNTIGSVTSILGEENLNISSLSVSGTTQRKQAVMVFGVDGKLSNKALKKIDKIPVVEEFVFLIL
uniref:ACT domain-containing protein n=1 Tax=Tanacetum cinerariifolium TaxID=118510 RepID=A0A6L2MX86_TANCI|nr:ACT domain-containing protein [Tanacetum cinerariifolium]